MKLFKIILSPFLMLAAFFSIAFIFQIIVSRNYSFPASAEFHGQHLYNPYKGIDSSNWRIANFHAHSRKFPESENQAARAYLYIDSIYGYFGYDIISISDYQSINRYQNKNKWFVPVYEHGYQYYKNHQLVINAKWVNWLDFVFRQSLNNKQFVLNNLKKDPNVLLTIVHPAYRKAYTFENFRQLSNFDCLEIANHDRFFTSFYDSILSNGHPVFIMADDDMHELNNVREICTGFNLINSDLIGDSIVKALKTGRSVGVRLNPDSSRTFAEKKEALLALPAIEDIVLDSDTFTVKLNKPVNKIRFIGQNGADRLLLSDTCGGSYIFGTNDTYIRTEIECYDSTLYFLNPVFRYDGVKLTYYAPQINRTKTWAKRSAVFALIVLIFIKLKFNKARV